MHYRILNCFQLFYQLPQVLRSKIVQTKVEKLTLPVSVSPFPAFRFPVNGCKICWHSFHRIVVVEQVSSKRIYVVRIHHMIDIF